MSTAEYGVFLLELVPWWSCCCCCCCWCFAAAATADIICTCDLLVFAEHMPQKSPRRLSNPISPRCARKKADWILPAGHGLDPDYEVLLRVRQRINAAKNLKDYSWQQLLGRVLVGRHRLGCGVRSFLSLLARGLQGTESMNEDALFFQKDEDPLIGEESSWLRHTLLILF